MIVNEGRRGREYTVESEEEQEFVERNDRSRHASGGPVWLIAGRLVVGRAGAIHKVGSSRCYMWIRQTYKDTVLRQQEQQYVSEGATKSGHSKLTQKS